MSIETLGNLASNLYSGLKLLPAKTSAFVNFPNSCIESVKEGAKEIYRSAVENTNSFIEGHLHRYPNANLTDLHNAVMNDPTRVEIIYQAKAYLEKCGVNPDSIATLSPKAIEVLAVPEFEITLMILAGMTLGSVALYKMMRKFGGSNLFYHK